MRQEMINWKMIGTGCKWYWELCILFFSGCRSGLSSWLIQRGRGVVWAEGRGKNLCIYILKGIKMMFLIPRLSLLQTHKLGSLWDNTKRKMCWEFDKIRWKDPFLCPHKCQREGESQQPTWYFWRHSISVFVRKGSNTVNLEAQSEGRIWTSCWCGVGGTMR